MMYRQSIRSIGYVSLGVIFCILFLAPIVSYASVDSFILNFNKYILNPLIVFLFTIALLVFVYGVLEFLLNAENDEKRTVGKMHMLWGLVGLTIMFSVWFLFGLIIDTFNIKGVDPEEIKVELDDYEPTINLLE